MHLLGARGELWKVSRSGREQQVLIVETEYNYMQPRVHEFNKYSVRISSGDELVLKCFFNTNDGERFRNVSVSWGDGAMVYE